MSDLPQHETPEIVEQPAPDEVVDSPDGSSWRLGG